MKQVDLVVFDIAGTTIADLDFVGLAVQEAFRNADIELSMEEINPIMGIAKPTAIRMLLEKIGSDADPHAIHDDFVAIMKSFYANDPRVAPIEGAEDVFAELQTHGIKVALDTGFTSEITAVILERLGWQHGVVDGFVSSDQVVLGRPSPDMIEYHMAKFGISDPARVAKVGDAPVDLQEGTNAKCKFVVGVLTGVHSKDQLEEHPHTHLVDSIREVPGILLKVDVLV